jgi:hypothetical protein
MAKLSVYSISDWVIYGLVFALSLGQLEQWTGFFNINVWLFFFLFTLIALSLFIISAEKQYVRLTRKERLSIFYLLPVVVVWYYQKIHILKNSSSSAYEANCKRDLLLVSSIVTATTLTLSSVSVFIALTFLI